MSEKTVEQEVAEWKARGSIPPVVVTSPGHGATEFETRLYEEWAKDTDYVARCFDRLANNPGEHGFYYPWDRKDAWPALSKKYRRQAELARQGMNAYEIAVATGEWPAGVQSRITHPDGRVELE